MTAVSDADRAKAAEPVPEIVSALSRHRPRSAHFCRCGWEGDDIAVHLYDVLSPPVAAALAEARAPYDRLTADLRALTEEMQGLARDNYPVTARTYTDAAARLRAVVGAAEGE